MNNQQQAKQLTDKLDLIKTEISAKEKEILKLREANAKLIEIHLGKERKPRSLETQRNAITKIDLEILELQLVEKSLNGKLKETDALIRQDQLKTKISQFNEDSKTQRMLIESVRRNLKALEKSLLELEQSSGRNHCLYQILQLLFEDPDNVIKEISLNNILQDWAPEKVVLGADFNSIAKRLDRHRVDIGNLWNQLEMITLNKRSYHRVEEMKKPINQHVGNQNDSRIRAAAQDAIERAKNRNVSKKIKIQSPKFIPDTNPNLPRMESWE